MINKKSFILGCIISLVLGLVIGISIVKFTESIKLGIFIGILYSLFSSILWIIIASFIFGKKEQRKMKKRLQLYVIICTISFFVVFYTFPIVFLNNENLEKLPTSLRLILGIIGLIGFFGCIASPLITDIVCKLKRKSAVIKEDDGKNNCKNKNCNGDTG